MDAEFSWEEAVAMSGQKDKGDDCIAIFHMESREDFDETEKQGKKIFKDIPYVMIMGPGNDKEIIDRAVLQRDIERFPKEWYKFKHNEKPEIDGFPVDEWPQISKSQADTLKANHMYSVEQLARAPDQNLSGLGMGMMALKNKAKTWLQMQDEEVSVQKLAAKNRKQAKEIDDLKKKVAAFEGILEEIRAEKEEPVSVGDSKKK